MLFLNIQQTYENKLDLLINEKKYSEHVNAALHEDMIVLVFIFK